MKRFVILILLLISLIASASQAQADRFVLFLGQVDGHTSLYSATLDGIVTPLASSDAGDVLLYDGDSSSASFVTKNGDGALTLHITDLNSLATTQLPLGSLDPTRLVLTEQAVQLLARSTENKPTLMTFDRVTLAPIAQRSTQRSDSAFTIQAQGNWVMAYNPAGALDVFSLPTIDSVNFELPNVAYSTPVWSPSRGQLQFIGGTSANPNERFIYLMDFDASTTQRFPLPAISGANIQQSQWSAHGRYILTSSRQVSGTLLLTDVTNAAQTTISEPGFILTPMGWSYDDSWLLYTAQISAYSPTDLFAYNVITSEQHPIHDLIHTPVTVRWANDTNEMLVLAQGTDQMIGVFTTEAPSFDTWQSLIPSVDGAIVQSSIQWTGTTLLLEYDGALLGMDTATGVVLRLAPESITVVANSVQMIG